jgi:hypothetical protein
MNEAHGLPVLCLLNFVIAYSKVKVKVKQSGYRPGVAQRVPGN